MGPKYIIFKKKANSRLLLLRKASEYTNSNDDLKSIYISHIRSILEQSCVVWDMSLTEENKNDLERTQKSFAKLVLNEDYKNYKNALFLLKLQTLS